MSFPSVPPQIPTVSFEFFPPNSEKGFAALFNRMAEFEELEPTFVSVTYGAGGGTREKTIRLVLRLVRETKLNTVPHLTCIGHSVEEIDSILQQYAEAGISSILALRGDAPANPPDEWSPDGVFSNAAGLVRHIKQFGERNNFPFTIGVAGFPEGHPDTPNSLKHMDHLKEKVDQGADWICTQLFFNNNAFHDWRERVQLSRIDIPVLAGVMPISSAEGLHRMADLAGGTVFPAPLLKAIERCDGDKEAVAEIGVHWATEQCRDLLDHDVDGIHFYTLNKSDATKRIHRSLGVKTFRSLREGS